MISNDIERIIGRLLYLGAPIVTIFVLVNTVTDPVNVTKLFALGGLAGGLLVPLMFFWKKTEWGKFKVELLIIGSFLFFSLLSSIMSIAPFTQSWYGVYGRNTGFLTYFFLSICFLSSLLITEIETVRRIVLGFLSAGIINLIYCSWVLVFGDFIGWNNPYGSILGLFGNPDFISAFLGMFIVGLVAFTVKNATVKILPVTIILVIVAFLEILKSHAIQGLVVTFGGLAVVIFFLLRNKYSSLIVNLYSFFVLLVGLVAIFGTLQKGPLSFIYKKSVSLRGSYWKAGMNMGSDNPIFGVGMDNYGDWYRRARPPVALIDTPAIHVMSNVSHNVVIDFFAFGGYPLLISYLGFISLGVIAIVRGIRISKNYDPIFVTLTAVWTCYQVQSIISINQIGLAIWGWLLTGLLISHQRNMQKAKTSEKNPSKKSQKLTAVISPGLLAMLGVVAGFLVSWPALNSDAKFFAALNSKDAAQIEAALTPSLVNPASSSKYTISVDLFMRSNLLNPALKYAREAVKFNPDSFDSWRQLYFLDNSMPDEKTTALQNMKRLDPRNPNVLSTS